MYRNKEQTHETFTLIAQMKQALGPVSKVGIADLPLLRTLLAIPQKLQEPSFWEVINSLFHLYKQVCQLQ